MANRTPKGVKRMREIGRLGGVASGKARMRVYSSLERRLLAAIAARARWGKPKWSPAEEKAWREGWLAGQLSMSGWPRDRRAPRTFIPATD